MPQVPDTTLLATLAAAALLAAAILLLTGEATRKDVRERIRTLARPGRVGTPEPSRPGPLDGFARLGEALRDSALLSPRDIQELEQAVRAAGLPARRAVPVLIGAKVLLVLLCPALALAYGALHGLGAAALVAGAVLAAGFGVLLPTLVLRRVAARYRQALARSLPDALDLLVICTEAGLGLESAVERVALEMRHANAAAAFEFGILAQELRIIPDRRVALANMSERSGMESLQRLGSMLAQTLRFGTPLGAALRVLAAEMRTERMIRLEERALRLPALLTLPLVLFILPCLFIILAGPAVIQVLQVTAR